MPAPSRLRSATSSMVVMPLTASCELEAVVITVPDSAGANVFLIQIGICRRTAGAMVCGWMTLAPK